MAAEDYEDETVPAIGGWDAHDKLVEADYSDGNRVAKVLARAGVASRREVERLIEAGRVSLNGQILTTPAVKVEADDILTVDGVVIAAAEPTRLFRYHKPVGLVTSHNDPKGRPTVFQMLPPDLPRVISVGRLDLASEGLLLLTNDGALTRALELPSTGWARVYRARAYGMTTQEKLDTLKDGVTVEGVRYGSIEAKLDKATGRNIWLTVTLAEGKNREVRRVLESIGLKVNRLIRLAYGPFSLGTLAVGHVEEVGPRVIRELLGEHIDDINMPVGNAVQYKAPASAQSRREPNSGTPQKVAAKPEKPVRKEGWAKPKKKAVVHVMPKKPKAKIVADFGPGKRVIKETTFRSNAPLENADRISKTRLNAPDRVKPGKAPKDLRPQHFKDRDKDAVAAPKGRTAPTSPAKDESAVDAQARKFRLALEALEDDRGPPKGRGPVRPGKPGGRLVSRQMGRGAPVDHEPAPKEKLMARGPGKPAPRTASGEFKTKAHWFKAPETAPKPAARTDKPTGKPRPGGKPPTTRSGPPRSGAPKPGGPKRKG